MRDYNFFSSMVEKKSSETKRNPMIMMSVIAVLILLVAYAALFGLNMLMNNDVNSMKSYLADNEAKDKEILTMKQKITIGQKYIAYVNIINSDIAKTDIISKELMDKISGSVPQNTYITLMSMTGSKLNITAVGDNAIKSAEFIYNLKQLNLFLEVSFSSQVKQSETSSNYQFSISCIFKDVITQ